MQNLRIEIKWAIIFTLMMLLWMTVERLAGFHDERIAQHETFTMFIFIPAVTIFVLALLDKRNNFYNGTMTYKQGFICGFIITVMVTLLSPVTQYFFTSIISPQYFSNATNYMVSTGRMTQAAAEQTFNLQNYLVQGTIGSFIMGTVTAAVVAFFTKRKAPLRCK